jgi:molybdenum cofactor cytidylyltransferase
MIPAFILSSGRMYSFSQEKNLACVILSGGWSSRMGSPKAFLPFDDHRNFLQHIVLQYRSAGISDLVVVVNHTLTAQACPMLDCVRVIPNFHPDLGRVYSIKLGLEQLGLADFCFVQQIDNPFVDVSLITKLISHRNNAEYITPDWQGRGGHPIVLSRPVMDSVLKVTSDCSLRDMLVPFTRFHVPAPDANCLININDPSDYAQYFPHLKTVVNL